MNNQQALVDQIVQNLSFEVEAVPKNKSIQATSISHSTPLSVKIKVKKKEDIHTPHDVPSIAEDLPRTVQKIRLVNSDRTIMTFDVFMEAEFDKKPPKKIRKHIFDMLRPGICLGAVDDDEYPYMPNSSYSAIITEPSVVVKKSDGTLKQTFTLSKNVYQDYTVSTHPEENKWLFGKCKPGGCLDPPFSEDKYSYKPSTRLGPEREEQELPDEEDVRSDVNSNKKPITLHDEEAQSNGRHSSIFDRGLLKKKRKSSDKSTNTKLPDKTDSIVDIYQVESKANSPSAHSNSIITYPPKIRSDLRISDDKTVRSRGPSEDKSRKSFNDHSEPYFICPKGVNRIKDKEVLDPSDYPKQRSSDATDLRNSFKESFKMPVPLPIFIPVPGPIMSNRKPEVIATNNDILKTQGDNFDITELDSTLDQVPQDQDLHDAINIKDTDLPQQSLHTKSATGDANDKRADYFKIPSTTEQLTIPNEINEQNLDQIKIQLLKELDTENIKDTEEPNEKVKPESIKMPLLIPVPPNLSEPNRATVDSKNTIPNDINEQNLDGIKIQPLIELDKENIKDTKAPNKKAKPESLKMPLSIPVPFNLNEPNRAASDSKNINDKQQTSSMKLNQSKQSFEPKKAEDKVPEGSQDMQQNDQIDTGNVLQENGSSANATPHSQFSDIADTIPENYLHTRIVSSEQENKCDITVTIAPIIQEGIKREEEITKETVRPTEQNDAKDPFTKASIEEYINGDFKTGGITNETKIPANTIPQFQFSDIADTIPEIYLHNGAASSDQESDTEYSVTKAQVIAKDIKQDSEEEEITGEIEKPAKQNEIKDKDTAAAKYIKGSSDVHKMPDTNTHQIKGSPNKNDRKYSQRISQSKLPVFQNSILSFISGSKTSTASVKDKTKRTDSSDKHLYDIGHRDTDLISHKHEKQTTLPGKSEYRSDSQNVKTLETHTDKEYLGKTTIQNNDDYSDFCIESQIKLTNGGSMNVVAAPVILESTEPISNFEPVKQVYSETNIFAEIDHIGVPLTTHIASRFRVFDDNDGTHSSISHELFGTKSVIYDTEEYNPSTSTAKSTERIPSSDKRVVIPANTVLSSIQSSCTLKSAMKKDTIAIELGFHSLLNDKNERILRTFDVPNAPKRLPNDSVTVLKSQIRISSNEIRVPVDSEHDMAIQIKKANANQRVSISESGFVNVITNSKEKTRRSPMQCSDAEIKSSEAKTEGKKDNDAMDNHFLDYYEQELVPLQLIIKNLRNEIDVLAAQQLMFKDKLYCENKSKLPRLVHSNKKCFGCLRK